MGCRTELPLADAFEPAHKYPTAPHAQAFAWADFKHYHIAHETIAWALQLPNETFEWAHDVNTLPLPMSSSRPTAAWKLPCPIPRMGPL